MSTRDRRLPSTLPILLPRLGAGLLFAAGTAAWAVYGETRMVTPETPLPADWVILGPIHAHAPWLGVLPDEKTRLIMDTLAPFNCPGSGSP